MAEPATRGWQFDRTVNLSNLVAIIGMVMVAVSWSGGMEQRVAANTQAIAFVRDTQTRNWELSKEARSELKGELAEINDKLDRLLSGR